jgi:hypothetical protein
VTENLSQLEFEVEQARAKLANDLAILRSPQTYRDFAAEVKSDTRSLVQRALDDIKARAATNPTAALAIGAGLGWRLIKHPPIATALIGAGLYSLWRTTPEVIDDNDYLNAAQRRLGQVSDAAKRVKEYAAEKAVAAQEKASAYTKLRGKLFRKPLVRQSSKQAKVSGRRGRLRQTLHRKLSTPPNGQHHGWAVLWPMKGFGISSYWELPEAPADSPDAVVSLATMPS